MSDEERSAFSGGNRGGPPQQHCSGDVLPDALLQRLPQRLDLREAEFPPVVRWLGSFWAVVGGGALWAFFRTQFLGFMVTLVLLVVYGGAVYGMWKAFRLVGLPLLRYKGFFPYIEYLPAEGKVVVHDAVGLELLYRSDAEITLFLGGLKGIEVSSQEGGGWLVSLVTCQQERIPIRSSCRPDAGQVQELACRLAAMLGLRGTPSGYGSVKNSHL